MDIKTFKVERWMDEYETKCEYNLAETCIDSLTVREVVGMAGLDVAEYMNELADIRLTYSHIGGSPELLQGIASLYSDLIKPEHIIPMHGAIGANYQVLMTLIDPGDNMVSVMPTYQQHYSIPESIGAEVRILNTNRQILDDWVNATPEVYYQRPEAGTTALVYYKKNMPSRELCDKLIKER